MKAKYTLTVEAIDDSGETVVRSGGTVTVENADFSPRPLLNGGTLAATSATLQVIASAAKLAAPRATVTVDGPNLDLPANRPS